MEGAKILIVSCGDLLTNVMEAIKISKASPTVIDARFILPFDFETFYKYAYKHEKIIILEEGVFGGISNIILSELIEKKRFDIISKIQFINTSKLPVLHSSRRIQLQENQMSPEQIAEIIESLSS
jgi:1-deoxy-D-xylulose-5-phosphate synthase